MLHYVWPSRGAVSPQPPVQPVPPQLQRQRCHEPQPLAGLPPRPHCAACAHDAAPPQAPPPLRPAPRPATNRRPGAIDPSRPCCPPAGGAYQGWGGLGNRRAQGHPSGGPWRPWYGRSGPGYFRETSGTLLHGKRRSGELISRGLACLAEGLGLRATARVCEVAPHTVLPWWGAAAEPLRAFMRSLLCAGHAPQLQLDAFSAVLRALKTSESSEDDARKRLEGARPGRWTAIAPVRQGRLALAGGPRPVAMAQRVGHQVAQRFASPCMPLWLSDGFTGSPARQPGPWRCLAPA